MKVDLDSQNNNYISESGGIVVLAIQPRLIGIDLASKSFEKEIQRNFESLGNLGRCTTQKDCIINKLSVIDGLNAYDEADSREIPFVLQYFESSSERVCYKDIEKGGHCATLSDSSLSLKERGWSTIDQGRNPRFAYTGFNPSYEFGRETIIFHNLEDVRMSYSIKSICKI